MNKKRIKRERFTNEDKAKTEQFKEYNSKVPKRNERSERNRKICKRIIGIKEKKHILSIETYNKIR